MLSIEEMIRLAAPAVVHCETAESEENELARNLSSSISSAGTLRLLNILGRKTLVAGPPYYMLGPDSRGHVPRAFASTHTLLEFRLNNSWLLHVNPNMKRICFGLER